MESLQTHDDDPYGLGYQFNVNNPNYGRSNSMYFLNRQNYSLSLADTLTITLSIILSVAILLFLHNRIRIRSLLETYQR